MALKEVKFSTDVKISVSLLHAVLEIYEDTNFCTAYNAAFGWLSGCVFIPQDSVGVEEPVLKLPIDEVSHV